MQKEKILSIGAVVLAFLASQHHALHMLVLAFGMGGASTSLMTTAPLLRRAMLSMSLVMVAVMAYQMWRGKRGKALRILNAVSIVITLGLMAWSVKQFGL